MQSKSTKVSFGYIKVRLFLSFEIFCIPWLVNHWFLYLRMDRRKRELWRVDNFERKIEEIRSCPETVLSYKREISKGKNYSFICRHSHPFTAIRMAANDFFLLEAYSMERMFIEF